MRKTRIWTSSMVRDVLRNEQYTGVRISQKFRKDRLGKIVKTETDEQFRTENDHEALISVKNFKLAQNVLRPYVSAGEKRAGDAGDGGDDAEYNQRALLSGLLRCGKCHRMMVISSNTAHCERERILGGFSGPGFYEPRGGEALGGVENKGDAGKAAAGAGNGKAGCGRSEDGGERA